MAYDEGLAQRIREHLQGTRNIEEKKMFGGLCFMVSRHMCCGIIKDKLMARVGPDNYEKLLKIAHAKKMDFTGKPMKGMIYVEPEGLQSEKELEFWVNKSLDFISTLPSKK